MDEVWSVIGQLIGYSLILAGLLGALGLCLKAFLWVMVLMGVM